MIFDDEAVDQNKSEAGKKRKLSQEEETSVAKKHKGLPTATESDDDDLIMLDD